MKPEGRKNERKAVAVSPNGDGQETVGCSGVRRVTYVRGGRPGFNLSLACSCRVNRRGLDMDIYLRPYIGEKVASSLVIKTRI